MTGPTATADDFPSTPFVAAFGCFALLIAVWLRPRCAPPFGFLASATFVVGPILTLAVAAGLVRRLLAPVLEEAA